MRTALCLIAALALLPVGARAADAQHPDWAFPVRDPNAPAPAPGDKTQKVSVPGSDASFTRAELADPGQTFADWFPADHPADVPQIVALGRDKVRACAICHAPDGMGHPESANLAGLTAEYQIRQWQAMKDGSRKAGVMNGFAAAISDEDMRAASVYFAATPPRPLVKLVEAATAPQTFVGAGNLRRAAPGGGTEPLGLRIIEVPDDAQQTGDLRNPHSGFKAYVPVGSIAQGRALATSGAGKTVACALCHGEGLKGLADVPRLAGRSPTVIARELYLFQNGERANPEALRMKPVVAKLGDAEIIAIAAYVASLPP